MRRARLSVAVVAALSIGVGLTLLDGCPAPATSPVDRICTPGNYVYCRCEDRAEGTKLCGDAGNAFADCNCGENGKPPPGFIGQEAGPIEHIDAALPPDSPRIDAKCGGKLAVIASTEIEDPQDANKPLYVYGAAYQADGTWAGDRSKGGPLRGPPRGGLVGTTLVVVWQSMWELIGWTKFDANQKDVLPFVSVGSSLEPVFTNKPPAFVGSPASGRIYRQGVDDAGNDDDTLHEGIYSPATGWDDALAVVDPGPAPVPGMSAPTATLLGTSYVLAFAGSDGSLAVQEQSSGSWNAPAAVPGATVQTGTIPAMTSLSGGPDELLIVYIGSDLALHWTSRATGGSAFTAPAVVDPGAVPAGDPSIASMSKGRAMLVWRAVNASPFFSVYDPAANPKWTSPAPYFANNPHIDRSPSVSTGKCASDATSAYVDSDGTVFVALFSDKAWTGPYLVPGLTKMTYAAVGEVP
jgi:hypothetical protein